MVDGVLASCYADVDHDLGQLSMIPMKWFAKVIEFIFGDDLGVPVYITTTIKLSEVMMPDFPFSSY